MRWLGETLRDFGAEQGSVMLTVRFTIGSGRFKIDGGVFGVLAVYGSPI